MSSIDLSIVYAYFIKILDQTLKIENYMTKTIMNKCKISSITEAFLWIILGEGCKTKQKNSQSIESFYSVMWFANI